MIILWHEWKPYVFRNAIFLFLALLVAFGLKYHYSRADSDELVWILTPTAEMVEQVSGIQFVREDHTGYVAQTRRIIIAPSCAGINFMLMAFCMAVFSGINYFSYKKSKLAWMAACLASSYLLTIAVNTTRIIISMILYDADIYSNWITSQRVHRLEGILIYFFALRLFYIIISWMLPRITKGPVYNWATGIHNGKFGSGWRRWSGIGWVPLFWYSVIALGIPFLNTAGQPIQTQLIEHSWMVISGCLAVFVLVFFIQLSCRGLKDSRRVRKREYRETK